MNDVYLNIKSIGISTAFAVMSFLNPIRMDIAVIVIMIVANFVAGWLESTLVERDRFRLDKFTKAMSEGVVYVLLIIGAYMVLKIKGIEQYALYCTSIVSYAVMYFLGLNILRNLIKLLPNSKVLVFLYYLMNIEFVKKIPLLSKFLEYNDKGDEVK